MIKEALKKGLSIARTMASVIPAAMDLRIVTLKFRKDGEIVSGEYRKVNGEDRVYLQIPEEYLTEGTRVYSVGEDMAEELLDLYGKLCITKGYEPCGINALGD